MTRTEAIEIISRVEVGTKAAEAARNLAIFSLRQMDYLIETHQVIEIKDVPDEVLAQIREGLEAGEVCTLEQTNADKIRAMSDEELADLLTKGKNGFDCFRCRDSMHDCEVDCVAGCLEWLRQPAENISPKIYGEENIHQKILGENEA